MNFFIRAILLHRAASWPVMFLAHCIGTESVLQIAVVYRRARPLEQAYDRIIAVIV